MLLNSLEVYYETGKTISIIYSIVVDNGNIYQIKFDMHKIRLCKVKIIFHYYNNRQIDLAIA
jgi:hypothetical protein